MLKPSIKMKILFVVFAALVLSACQKEEETESPLLIMYQAGWRTYDQEVSKVQHQGSHFLMIQRAAVTLKLWQIDDGKKTQIGKLRFDPSIHESAYVSPFIGKEKSYIDFAARRIRKVDGDSWDEFGIEFPTPYLMGCGNEEARLTLEQSAIILKFWIAGSADVSLPSSDTRSIESMLSASAKKDVSYFVVEADPE